MRIAPGIVHSRIIRIVVYILLIDVESIALIGVQMRRVAVRIILHLGGVGIYIRVGNWAGVDLALSLGVVLLTVVDERSYSLSNRGVYFVLNVRLYVRNNVLKRKSLFFRQVFHYWVELKDVAGHVYLDCYVNPLEEVVAKREEVLESGDLPRPSVPEDHLEPLDLCF